MAEDELQQDELFAHYWEALADNPAALPPPGLNPVLVRQARQMQPPDPSAEFIAHLEQQLRALPASTAADDAAAPLLRSGLPVRLVRPIPQPRPRWLPQVATIIVVAFIIVTGSLLIRSVPNGIQPSPVYAPTAIASTPNSVAQLPSVGDIIQKAQSSLAVGTVQSYVFTATSSSQSVTQQHDGMQLWPVPSGENQLRSITTIWYQAPNMGRIETTQVVTQAGVNGQNIQPPVQVSDGVHLWSYDPQDKLASVGTTAQPTDGNRIRDEDIVTRTLNLLRPNNCSGPPVLHGSDTVAGRAAYIIQLGTGMCPGSVGSYRVGGPIYGHIIWLDKQTYLLLKDEEVSSDDLKPISTWEVTDIRVNLPLDHALFTFTPPADVKVVANIWPFMPIPVMPPLQPTPSDVSDIRQAVSFPIFLPAYIPARLTAEPPNVSNEGSGMKRVAIYYHTNDGTVPLEIINDSPDKDGNNLYVTSGETATLSNGVTAYFQIQPYTVCQDNTNLIYWVQDNTYIAIGSDASSNSGHPLGRAELLKIANSMSQTTSLGRTEIRAAVPKHTAEGLDQIRERVCIPVFVPTYLPAGVVAAPPQFQDVQYRGASVQVAYHTDDGATAFTVINSLPTSDGNPNQQAVNIKPVMLPNGITAHFYTRPVECGYGNTALYWQQDGAFISIEGLPPGSMSGGFQLTKEQMVKIAASMSSSAELGSVQTPAFKPTDLPFPDATAPTCPTPLMPAAVPTP